MKTLLFILLSLSSLNVISQTINSSTNLVGQSYITKTSIVIHPYDPTSDKIAKNVSFQINDGIKFFVYKVLDSGYVISVWDFTKTSDKIEFYKKLDENTKLDNPVADPNAYYKMSKIAAGLKDETLNDKSSPFYKYDRLAYVDYWANNMQFFIALKDFNSNCEPIYPKTNSFTWGFLTLPIKARFGNSQGPFTFEETVNFGISLGWKHQYVSKTECSSNILGGISISSVKINNPTGSASALSFSGGYMFQYDKFQAGIFTGLDFVSQPTTPNWAYQGKPWIGFAIGVSLFGESKTAASTNQSQGK